MISDKQLQWNLYTIKHQGTCKMCYYFHMFYLQVATHEGTGRWDRSPNLHDRMSRGDRSLEAFTRGDLFHSKTAAFMTFLKKNVTSLR